MNEQQIRQIVKEEMSNNYRSGTPQVSPHQHNGNDNLKINAKDIIPNAKNLFEVSATPGTAQENQLTINGLFNPSLIYFNGLFLANDPISGNANKKAIISGTAHLGNVSYYKPVTATYGINVLKTIDPTTGESTIPNIIQSNSSTGFNSAASDGTGPWSPYMLADPFNLGTVIINGFNLFRLQIISFSNTSITLQAPLTENCTVTGSIIIT